MPAVGTTPAQATTTAAAGQTTEVEGRGDPGDRGHRHERRGEQVGEHADDAHRPLEQHDDRRGHRLRRDGDREGGARAARAGGGIRAPMASPHGRVKRSRPRVASEDRAKP